jgi:hypothetical protein
MDFVMNLLSGGASGILGGITGLIGVWLKSKHEAKMVDLKRQERKEERDHELDTMKMEHDNAIAVANVQREETADKEAGASHRESYKMEPKRFSEGMTFPDTWIGRRVHEIVSFLMFVLDFFRGMMRPGLTLYMAILITMIYWQLMTILKGLDGAWDDQTAIQAVTMIVHTFLYLFVTSFVWWFGDRNRAKPPTIG